MCYENCLPIANSGGIVNLLLVDICLFHCGTASFNSLLSAKHKELCAFNDILHSCAAFPDCEAL